MTTYLNSGMTAFQEIPHLPNGRKPVRYLVASDFDQTLSLNDSGYVLGEILGIHDFEERVDLIEIHFIEPLESSGLNAVTAACLI